jgi:hypothetical protein
MLHDSHTLEKIKGLEVQTDLKMERKKILVRILSRNKFKK